MKKFKRLLKLLGVAVLLFGFAVCCVACNEEDAPENESELSSDTEAPETESSSETNEAMPKATLIFEDNFDGDELDTSKWEKCPEWNRREHNRWSNEMSFLDGNGHYVSRMIWDAETQQVVSGGIRTKGIFEYGYGYYEASIKFPKAPGSWGAFWLMAGDLNNIDGSAADGVEIDVIESISNDKGRYNHNLHWDGYGEDHKEYKPTVRKAIDIYDGKFHTFGVLCNEEGYFFYVDGVLSGIAYAFSCAPCPLDRFMILSGEAADWAGAGTPESIAAFPVDILVDYVRVYSDLPY